MEVLSDILRSMRVECSVYYCETLSSPWSMDFVDTTAASFHLIRRGHAWVSSKDQEICLSSGDLVFIESGKDHVLSSHPPDQQPTDPGGETLLLCGYWRYAHEVSTPLLDVFPSLTVIREEELLAHPWLKKTLDQLSSEYSAQRPGADLIVNRLTEVVLIELIRISFGRSEKSQFVRALTDEKISGALKHLHSAPEEGWTLDLLGEMVGMSRAVFAKRFKELVGQPMFEYLTQLRVQRAKNLLQTTSLGVFDVATRVGYSSDLAFTKVFKKHTGETPTSYRKQLSA
ncbi:MAG: AraC family transcriptional regulator [Pseudomonadota bacterium]